MHRFVIVTLAIGLLSACSSATPTAKPTTSPAATATPASPPTATPMPPPSATPASSDGAKLLPPSDNLEPGRYFLDFGGFRFTFTVADVGWSADPHYGGVFRGDDSEIAIFWPGGELKTLYADPCKSPGTVFEPGPTVDDLVDALASLDGFEATTPSDVTISGYSGTRIALSVPVDVDVRSSACVEGKYSLANDRWFQAAGQTDDMRVLDLDGERQLVTTSTTPATTAETSAQLDEMLESLVIERR